MLGHIQQRTILENPVSCGTSEKYYEEETKLNWFFVNDWGSGPDQFRAFSLDHLNVSRGHAFCPRNVSSENR